MNDREKTYELMKKEHDDSFDKIYDEISALLTACKKNVIVDLENERRYMKFIIEDIKSI